MLAEFPLKTCVLSKDLLLPWGPLEAKLSSSQNCNNLIIWGFSEAGLCSGITLLIYFIIYLSFSYHLNLKNFDLLSSLIKGRDYGLLFSSDHGDLIIYSYITYRSSMLETRGLVVADTLDFLCKFCTHMRDFLKRQEKYL